MNAVYVVAAHDVHHHIVGLVLGSLQRRVEPPHTVGQFQRQFRLLTDDGRVGDLPADCMVGPVGIEPGVQLEAARVGRLDPELERVVERFRRFALFAGEVVRPRFQRAGVEGVCLRPHLEDDGVEVVIGQQVEQGDGFCFLLFYRQPRLARPVDIGYGGYPGGAELALGGGQGRGVGSCWRRLLGGGRRCLTGKQGGEKKEPGCCMDESAPSGKPEWEEKSVADWFHKQYWLMAFFDGYTWKLVEIYGK